MTQKKDSADATGTLKTPNSTAMVCIPDKDSGSGYCIMVYQGMTDNNMYWAIYEYAGSESGKWINYGKLIGSDDKQLKCQDTPALALLPNGNVLLVYQSTQSNDALYWAIFDPSSAEWADLGPVIDIDGHTLECPESPALTMLPVGNALLVYQSEASNDAFDWAIYDSEHKVWNGYGSVKDTSGHTLECRDSAGLLTLPNGNILMTYLSESIFFTLDWAIYEPGPNEWHGYGDIGSDYQIAARSPSLALASGDGLMAYSRGYAGQNHDLKWAIYNTTNTSTSPWNYMGSIKDVAGNTLQCADSPALVQLSNNTVLLTYQSETDNLIDWAIYDPTTTKTKWTGYGPISASAVAVRKQKVSV